jgi:putative flippase GtrA
MSAGALLKQFITFCGVGTVNTVAGLSIILFLSEIAGIHYMAANATGYAAGLLIAFFLHRRMTFREARHHAAGKQIAPFIAVFLVSYVCQFAVLVLLVDRWGINDALSQVVAVGVYAIVNFTGNKFMTFRAS